ncbi:MAG TPA: hypothetical protein VJS69_02505 [Candidatus Krumholzibacteria bacterium]|nr:hypothetical protein [Candidatus Krumholzibacteria bacterium]
MAAPLKFTDRRQSIFLAEVRRTGIIGNGCRAADVSRQTIREYREADKEFDQAVIDALEDYADVVENELQRRAVEGVEEAVFWQGKRIDRKKVRRYSDTLMLAAAKRRRAEYRERTTVDMNVTGGVLVIGGEKSAEEWAAKYGKRSDDKEP